MFAFDIEKMKVVGKEILLINGGTDISRKPVWIEGPHIFRKDGWYYLVCAEGGTGYNHSEVVFRSRNVDGPYISFAGNPILTQRQLDPKRPDPVTTVGHADFVETPEGKWYAVFLGCRPYKGNFFNMGRETFMLPVEWKEGWPHILDGDATIPFSVPVPFPAATTKVNNPFNGNFYFKDNFSSATLDPRWEFLRTPLSDWYKLSPKMKGVTIDLLPQTVSGKENPAFLGFRQQHNNGYAATSLNFSANDENEKAGMLVFQNESHFYYLCKSVKNGETVVQLFKSLLKDASGKMELMIEEKIPASKKSVQLKTEANGASYAFYYATKKGKWKLLKGDVEATFLSTETAGGFVGCMYALYATSSQKQSNNQAVFHWFETRSEDGIKQ